ncbi:DEAD/DEAH box helicase family protein [Novosphingobium sp. 32-60-15]
MQHIQSQGKSRLGGVKAIRKAFERLKQCFTCSATSSRRVRNLQSCNGTALPMQGNGLIETPYVCLRLPTGGGKTILAAHSITVAKESWLEKDFPLVLWLVPTTTIRRQTVEACGSACKRNPASGVIGVQKGTTIPMV